ncbi:MAG TPA: penicillin acylase family protein [bacterium]|nr:penicillin acylase family protein [bacterium]
MRRAARSLLALLLGRRLPRIEGTIPVDGLADGITIRRDAHGIPHIEARTFADAELALGFCHGQDRGFQLELLLRVARGTLSALVGARALPVDRLSRRIGFLRAAREQLAVLAPRRRASLEAYVRGIAAARACTPRPHELAMLRGQPTRWNAEDVLAVMKLQSFALASNWDMELERLRILLEDGTEALLAVDPVRRDWLPASPPPPSHRDAATALAHDLDAFLRVVGGSGGSNNWALAAHRTATGRAILANDPHLPPGLPSAWYLAHLATPEASILGASFVGGPGFPVAHNGTAAWGITAGLVDNTDLYLEEISPDGKELREANGFAPCAIVEERIEVRGGDAHVERVRVGPRGPIVGTAPDGRSGLSMRAIWLEPRAVDGLLGLADVRDFEDFRSRFAHWPGLPLNLVYADTTGGVGWQLVGEAPKRRKSFGTVPLPAWEDGTSWDGDVPFERMPFVHDPPEGFVATANNEPPRADEDPFLGADWIDDYRLVRIREELAKGGPWDRTRVQKLQLDVTSVPWRELRSVVLDAPAHDPRTARALDLLRAWDGMVSAESPAAAVFEVFLSLMARRLVAAKAPASARREGGVLKRLLPEVTLSVRRAGFLVGLFRTQPHGWFGRSWRAEIADALAEAVSYLETRHGPTPRRWKWGRVRPLTLKHPFGAVPLLAPIFDIGPIPVGGDPNTPAQASVDPFQPDANPPFIASLRAVFDVGAWEECRFGLPGGQSGNPCSPHYGDLLDAWRSGEGIAIAWDSAEVRAVTVSSLVLSPRVHRTVGGFSSG